MTAQRMAIVVLVLLAIAMVVVLWFGAGRDGPAQPAWAATLDSWFGSDATVRPGELRGPCVDDGGLVVAFGTSCDVEIRETNRARVRYLTLALAEGARARVEITPKDDVAAPMNVRLRAGMSKPPRLPILSGGASMTVRCDVGNPSTLRCRLVMR